MTGNQFLRYPPHKNTGKGFPDSAYNLVRFQMESAKLPYMKMKLPGGILEVSKIYENEYKTKWTPLGGYGRNYLAYILQYHDPDNNARVKFFSEGLIPVIDVPYDTVPFTTNADNYSVADMTSIEIKITDDLIGFLFNDPLESAIYYLYFYSQILGFFLDDSYAIGAHVGSNPPVLWTNMWAEDSKVYWVKSSVVPSEQYINKLAITLSGGEYSFAQSTVYPAAYEGDDPLYLVMEDGVLWGYVDWTGIHPGASIAGYIRLGLVTYDKDSGSPLVYYPGVDAGNGINYSGYQKPSLPYDVTYIGASQVKIEWGGPYAVDESPFQISNYGYGPAIMPTSYKFRQRWLSRLDTYCYNQYGTIYSGDEPRLPQLDWRQFDNLDTVPYGIEYNPASPVTDRNRWFGWDSVSIPFEDFCEVVGIDVDSVSIDNFKYVPHLDNDAAVRQFVDKILRIGDIA